MKYLFDTNILIHYIRRSPLFYDVERQYDPFGINNRPLISIVTVAEIKSFATQSAWGEKRWIELYKMLGKFTVIEVRNGILIDRYVQIDAFSQINFLNNLSVLPLATWAKTICGLPPRPPF